MPASQLSAPDSKTTVARWTVRLVYYESYSKVKSALQYMTDKRNFFSSLDDDSRHHLSHCQQWPKRKARSRSKTQEATARQLPSPRSTQRPSRRSQMAICKYWSRRLVNPLLTFLYSRGQWMLSTRPRNDSPERSRIYTIN